MTLPRYAASVADDREFDPEGAGGMDVGDPDHPQRSEDGSG